MKIFKNKKYNVILLSFCLITQLPYIISHWNNLDAFLSPFFIGFNVALLIYVIVDYIRK